ncbi:MAG TPA: hypothetical protein VN802_03510 [Stellaceae bacterium]|nr:hypothetical protein [Stellaceae bacterium]
MKIVKPIVKGDIVARVTLYGTSPGGRHGPTPRDELRCMMVIDGETLDVRLYFHSERPLRPGQTAKIPIRFLFPDQAKKLVSVGKTFLLREMNSIGEGVIDQVIMTV